MVPISVTRLHLYRIVQELDDRDDPWEQPVDAPPVRIRISWTPRVVIHGAASAIGVVLGTGAWFAFKAMPVTEHMSLLARALPAT